MILGMSPLLFLHVVISLVGIATGFVVMASMLASRRLDGLTATFLATTLLTSLSGFVLPAEHLMPSHVVGIISTVVLAATFFARYARAMAGPWRWIYVVTAVVAQWFNVFVLIAQLFQKVPALHALAPTGSEPPFAVAQLTVLAIHAAIAVLAVRKFRPAVGGGPAFGAAAA